MSMNTDVDEKQGHHGSLLSSWEKRKQAVLREKEEIEQREVEEERDKVEAENLLTDEDMPPIESLTADSDYSCFMSPRVSDALRRLALRKLFHGADFNICDGLDDYDGDYTSFAKLGNIVTADMKHQVEMELRKKERLLKEQAAKAELDNETEMADDTASNTASDTVSGDDKTGVEALQADESLEVDKLAGPEETNMALSATVDGDVERKPEAGDVDEFDNDDEHDDLDGGLPG
jgi:hypothetical protein